MLAHVPVHAPYRPPARSLFRLVDRPLSSPIAPLPGHPPVLLTLSFSYLVAQLSTGPPARPVVRYPPVLPPGHSPSGCPSALPFALPLGCPVRLPGSPLGRPPARPFTRSVPRPSSSTCVPAVQERSVTPAQLYPRGTPMRSYYGNWAYQEVDLVGASPASEFCRSCSGRWLVRRICKR